jgi:hypothetical protein
MHHRLSQPMLSSKAIIAGILAMPLAFGAMPSLASDVSGKFTVRGVGSSPCSTVIAAFKSNDKGAATAYASWIMGYTTGYNRFVPQTFDILPTPAGSDLVGIVAAVCRASPTASLESATGQALTAVAAMRLTRETPVVKLTSGGQSVELRQEAVTALQQSLTLKGLYKGPANGVSSPALISAIKALQTKEKLKVTGLPDIDTLIRANLKK